MDATQEGEELRALLLALGLYVLSVAAEEGDYPRSPMRFYIQPLRYAYIFGEKPFSIISLPKPIGAN